jgi:rubrerythrin
MDKALQRSGRRLANLKNASVFKKDMVVKWHCRNCCYVAEGKEAPAICPSCGHAQGYFEPLAENY